MTLYRKHRPQTIEEVDAGQTRRFLEQLRDSKLAHAYLFDGPKGIGKTSAARILAKIANCSSKRKDRPCQQCSTCQAITKGRFLDLHEIDAASNRGIDEIRQLRETVLLAPSAGKMKVYIIDEAHMLTREAWNAFLKTLEEPPSHAMFILCTTEGDTIPETIVSRCQRFVFLPARQEDLRQALERVLKNEKKTLEPAVLDAIIARAEGSFRDAVKLLEQAFLSGASPTSEDIDMLVRAVSWKDRMTFLRHLLQKNGPHAMEMVMGWNTDGIDVGLVLRDCLDDLRLCFLLAYGVRHRRLSRLDSSQVSAYESMRASFPLRDLIMLMRAFMQAAQEVKTSEISSLPLELLIAEYCGGGRTKGEVRIEKQRTKPAAKKNGNGRGSLSSIAAQWKAIVETIQSENYALGSVVRHARPISFDADILTIEVDYAYHRDRLEQPHFRRIIESAVTAYAGGTVRLKTALGARKIERTEDSILHAATEIFGGELVEKKGGDGHV